MALELVSWAGVMLSLLLATGDDGAVSVSQLKAMDVPTVVCLGFSSLHGRICPVCPSMYIAVEIVATAP